MLLVVLVGMQDALALPKAQMVNQQRSNYNGHAGCCYQHEPRPNGDRFFLSKPHLISGCLFISGSHVTWRLHNVQSTCISVMQLLQLNELNGSGVAELPHRARVIPGHSRSNGLQNGLTCCAIHFFECEDSRACLAGLHKLHPQRQHCCHPQVAYAK
jgi:hypothetical protein